MIENINKNKITEYLLYLFSIALFVSIAASQIILGILIAFLLYKIFKKEINLNDFPHWKIFFALIIFMKISYLYKVGYLHSMNFSLKKFFQGWLYLTFFVGFFLPTTDRVKNNILKAILFGALIVSLIIFFQFIYNHLIKVTFKSFNVLYSHGLTTANNLGLSIVVAYLMWIESYKKKNFKTSLKFLFLALFLLFCLTITTERGPILYTLFMILMVNSFIFKKKGILLNIFMIFLFIIIFLLSPTLQMRFSKIFTATKSLNSGVGVRLYLWKYSIDFIKKYPIFGTPQKFKKEMKKVVKEKALIRVHPHNAYLTLMIKYGVPTFLIYMLLFVMIYLKLFKAIKIDYYKSIMGISFVTVYLFEGLTENNFGDSEVKMLFWFTLGIIYSILFYRGEQVKIKE